MLLPSRTSLLRPPGAEPLGCCLNTRGTVRRIGLDVQKPTPNLIKVRGRPERSRLGRGVSRVLFPQPSLWDERHRSPQASLPQVVANRVSSPWRVAPPKQDVGLAADGVCLAAPVTRGTGALLPHRFTLTARSGARAVCFLLHYSVGLPRPAVSWHHALCCPDFPLVLPPAAAPSSQALIVADGRLRPGYQFLHHFFHPIPRGGGAQGFGHDSDSGHGRLERGEVYVGPDPGFDLGLTQLLW